MINFKLKEAVSVLSRTPEVLKVMLLGLDKDWLHHNEGKETWSPFDIVGHLIHGDKTDWMTRLRIILNESGERTFAPFDRFAQFENSRGKNMDQLLEEFAGLRAENLKKLDAMILNENDFDRKGIHPEFGEVTLRQLLATWVAHDLGHIAQISRVMANQYNGEVGPWSAYLRIINKT